MMKGKQPDVVCDIPQTLTPLVSFQTRNPLVYVDLFLTD